MRVIISYRRADSEVITGRIRDRLAARFGENSIFVDIDNVPFGHDFREHIKNAVIDSDLLIAVIGPQWTGGNKRGHHKINEETDPVRVEIETALQAEVPILPVLIANAKMPNADKIPASLREFCFLNAAPLDTGRDFSQHIERLIRTVETTCRISPANETAVKQAATKESQFRPLSIVVLPFENMSNDPAQEFFVEGLTDDLTTDLSRLPGSFVIARSTATKYRGKVVDPQKIGRDLHVRYVVQGSVRRLGNLVRVNAQLTDAETAANLWADRFDGAADDATLYDEIVGKLARSLTLRLVDADARKVTHSDNPKAVDLVMKAQAVLNRPRSRIHSLQAKELFDAALQIDDENVDALVGLAWVQTDLFALGWMEADGLSNASGAIEKAIALAPNHATAHWIHGQVLHRLGMSQEALSAFDLAIALDRNHSPAYDWRGYTKIFVGRAEETEADVMRAMQISPHDSRLAIMLSHNAFAYLCLGRLDEAVRTLREAIAANKNFSASYLYLTAAYALRGKLDSARTMLAEHDRLVPGYTIAKYLARQPSDNPTFLAQNAGIIQALREAGLPD